MKESIITALHSAESALKRFIAAPDTVTGIERIARQIADAYLHQGKVIIFGNGGSMCDAMHFAEELTGRFHQDRPALPAIAISDPAHITCVANDYGFEMIFARGVEAYATPGDIVIGISTSGSSENIYQGLVAAQARDCITMALLGKDGGKISGLCDFEMIVPGDTTDRIQELHTLILHILIAQIEYLLYYDPALQGMQQPHLA